MKLVSGSKRVVFGFSAKTVLLVTAAGLLLGVASSAQATTVSIKFTTDVLGLGSSDLNAGSVVDPDQIGFITSTTTGEGSILWVQADGTAGPGTALNPLLVTVTAKTRSDVVNGLPAVHDYHAGVLYITDESSGTPDGKDEGLGVRAFKVDGTTALREIDPGTGLPLLTIEGSKEISGGTDDPDYDPMNPNGAPHVDEHVNFDFNPTLVPYATSVEVILSKFDSDEIVDLHVELTTGTIIDLAYLETTDTSIFELVGDDVWKFKFSGVPGLSSADLIDSFWISANDNKNGATAEHFLITGLYADVVPEPSTIALLCLGGLMALRARRK